jgi:hypothetical protein
MRLRHRPMLRHLRSLIGLPTSDDERQGIPLQFVRTDRDLRRGPQSRVGHSRSISYFKLAVRRRATPSGSETQSRFALPAQPTQLGHCPTAQYISASFPHLLGCAAVTSWQRQLGRQNGIKLNSRASQRGADGQRSGDEIKDGYRIHADGGQVADRHRARLVSSIQAHDRSASLPQGEDRQSSIRLAQR